VPTNGHPNDNHLSGDDNYQEEEEDDNEQKEDDNYNDNYMMTDETADGR
jgi:hypothetical protein